MAKNRYIRFFDKKGDDMNLASTVVEIPALAGITGATSETFAGKIFFDRVSVGLIETQHMFLLQEVKGPSTSYNLKRLEGELVLVGGNPTITGSTTDFTGLTVSQKLQINGTIYEVASISGATSMTVTPTPSATSTTDDAYAIDYVVLATPRSSDGAYSETIKTTWKEEDIDEFFFYTVDYTQETPYITKVSEVSYEIVDGTADPIDSVSGRQIPASYETSPLQLNVGFSTSTEDIYEKTIVLTNEKEYRKQIQGVPSVSGTEVTFEITGTASAGYIFSDSAFELRGMTAVGATNAVTTVDLDLVNIGSSGSNTLVTFTYDTLLTNLVGLANFASFYLVWKNSTVLAEVELYAESIGEDERFKLVLENFGRKINYDQTYIFRDADINESLPDFKLLNNKRKELLLEGDNIFPYIGSYKALVNIIDYFGYTDVRIKEYFLNVDTASPNYNKFTHLLVPKDESQRKQVKDAWSKVPSKTYKKTALFGLFYDINKVSGEVDQYGIPEVVDTFDYSPEEVLAKLFGLKELLKKEFLPLNARIYDITGEGIYFERYRVDSWSDNLNYMTLDIGVKPKFRVTPEKLSYITDLRRIDTFYSRAYAAQGMTGFLGLTASNPEITPAGYTGSLSTLLTTYVGSFSNYVGSSFVYDPAWDYMPESIDEPLFNEVAATLKPLPDAIGIPSGAPVLLEAFFDISWEEATFTWLNMAILGPTGNNVNVNIWTWENIGRGEYTEMRWVISKPGMNAFLYDSGRLPIDTFKVSATGPTGDTRILHSVPLTKAGNYDIALYIYDVTNNFSVDFQKYEVKSRNADFAGIFRKETTERKISEFSNLSWEDVNGPWYYPIHVESSWEDAVVSWESMGIASYQDIEFKERGSFTDVVAVNRENNTVTLTGDLTEDENFAIGNFLFFSREENAVIQSQLQSLVKTFSIPLAGPTATTFLTGASGATVLSSTYNVSASLTSGDSILVGQNWQVVAAVGTTSVTLTNPLNFAFGPTSVPFYKADLTFTAGYTGTASPDVASRFFVADTDANFSDVDTDINQYSYFDVVSHDSANKRIVFSGEEDQIQKMIKKSWIDNSVLYSTWGLFAGTYALEISGVSLTGSNTVFRVKDPNKELYGVDGNFSIRAAAYDVDYAENRAQPFINWERGDEVTWEEQEKRSFYGTEYHATTSCGFVIPVVSPSSTIKVDENEVFQLSGATAIDSTKTGLSAAATELNASGTEGVNKYEYVQLPTTDTPLLGATGSIVVSVTASVGALSITMSGAPIMYLPASATASVSLGGTVSAINLQYSGEGYFLNGVTVSIDHPGGTGLGATASATVLNGRVTGFVIHTGGSGYTASNPPAVTISLPDDYREDDNYLWTGSEWAKVVGITGNSLLLTVGTTASIPVGTVLQKPYQYHKQLFNNPDLFQQYYYFIHAKAKNPSADMLSYVTFGSGMEGEWASHPTRSYSYPLRNSLLNMTFGESEELLSDHLYQRWVAEGSDYPPTTLPVDFASSGSTGAASRAYFTQTLQSAFAYIDTVISQRQETVVQNTPVVFTYDFCRIPGKKNPLWTITDENDDNVVAEIVSRNFSWTFTVPGTYKVALQVEDGNGNVSVIEKNSFIVVEL